MTLFNVQELASLQIWWLLQKMVYEPLCIGCLTVYMSNWFWWPYIWNFLLRPCAMLFGSLPLVIILSTVTKERFLWDMLSANLESPNFVLKVSWCSLNLLVNSLVICPTYTTYHLALVRVKVWSSWIWYSSDAVFCCTGYADFSFVEYLSNTGCLWEYTQFQVPPL
jgi:hypothetical protein